MDIAINIATLAGMTAAITEIIKKATGLSDRFVAGTALVIGIGLSLVFVGLTKQAALLGIVSALTASGLWSQANTWSGK